MSYVKRVYLAAAGSILAMTAVAFAASNFNPQSVRPAIFAATQFQDLSLSDAPTAVVWSKDGRMLAATSHFGNKISVFDAGAGALKAIFERNSGVPYLGSSLGFIANDTQIITPPTGEKTSTEERDVLAVWDSASGRLIQQVTSKTSENGWRSNWANIFVANQSSTFVAVTTIQNANLITVYEAGSWEVVRSLKIATNAGDVQAFVFSPNDHFLAVGTNGGRLYLFNMMDGKIVWSTLAYDGNSVAGIESLAFSPNGQQIVTGASISVVTNPSFAIDDGPVAAPPNAGPVRIWDANNGKFVTALQGKDINPIRSIFWSPLGDIIAFGAGDFTVRVWNPHDAGDVGRVLDKDESGLCLAFHPVDARLAIGRRSSIRIYELGNDSQ